jgi:Protein of unknown function (DUF3071)
MQELRLVAVSEDGTYVVLAQSGKATRFSLPNDERLRAVVRGQFSRLAQYEIEVENPLRPKEIQARIRAGETVEQIADAAGVPIERVRWFEGPVLAERAYVAQQAQTASVRRPGDSGPGPRLGEIVTERLRALGADPDEVVWDSRKRGDGSWLVELTCEAGGEPLIASWVFDPRRRHAIPEEHEAARLSLPEDALEAAGLALEPDPPARGGATVTPFVPRSSQASGGSGPSGSGVSPGSRVSPRASTAPRREAEPDRAAPGRDAEPAYSPVGRRAAALSGARAPVPGGSGVRSAVTTAPVPEQPPAAQPPAQSPAAQSPAAQSPAAQSPAAQSPAAQHSAVGDEAAGPSQPAAPQTGQETPARGRSGRKAAGGRGRRASVPTWDEIMFGSSRRTD